MTKIWILKIEHKHGEDYSAFETEAAAFEAAYQYVKENWSRFQEEADELESLSEKEAIEIYIEKASHFNSEWIKIEEVELSKAHPRNPNSRILDRTLHITLRTFEGEHIAVVRGGANIEASTKKAIEDHFCAQAKLTKPLEYHSLTCSFSAEVEIYELGQEPVQLQLFGEQTTLYGE